MTSPVYANCVARRIRTLLVIIIASSCVSRGNSNAAESKPNIVPFLVDDMGWKDSTPYGSQYYETPHMQRLAGQAMRFTDAYALPLCSPTRASILTGQYSSRHRITSATGHRPAAPPDASPYPEKAAPGRRLLYADSKTTSILNWQPWPKRCALPAVVLDAVKDAGQEENTAIILTSDHGASHKMEHKSTLYGESAGIPFIVMHKGTAPAGQVDETHLVSNGLDLLPTVCDYAGLTDAKADPRGRSLRPLIEGKEVADWRKTLGVESQVGRMVVGDCAKYIRYDVGKHQEQLLDLRIDPGEARHFTADPEHAGLLQELETAFDKEWFPQT